MTETSWAALKAAVRRYKTFIADLNAALPGLSVHIQKLVDGREGPAYTVETPVVYNSALDDLSPDSDIKMILVADNPGRREQAAENRRYLVGPSGKIAEKFFRVHPELGIDFRKNVIILNKTPVHTPRTAELKTLCALGGDKLGEAVLSSQKTMAGLLADMWDALNAGKKNRNTPVWIIGYSEMKKGGIFETYTKTLQTLCEKNAAFKSSILFFRHFSMNQFLIDLKQQAGKDEPLSESLGRIGAAYRKRVLGAKFL